MREIGSEFHITVFEKKHGLKQPVKGAFVFSGRTAIEAVLKEIPRAKNALLPSYCCASMIRPFHDAGINVSYYPVIYDRGLRTELEISRDTDVILWCNYFGFCNDMPDLADFIAHGGTIIEDITHSLYSDHSYHEQSQYLVASVRKWEPIICGGYYASRKGTIAEPPAKKPPLEFLKPKITAMQMKARYLDDDSAVNKNTYLQLFSQSNHWMAENYSGLTIDAYSEKFLLNADVKAHAKARRQNAKALYKALDGYVGIRFLFELSQMDCPLFVPILLEPEKRNAVRKKLVENQIFCPIHWPKPNEDCKSNLYDLELSLICDQRYNEEDMLRMASVLKIL